MRYGNERLHLDQQRPCSLDGGNDRRADGRAALRNQRRGGIRHFLQTRVVHLEDRYFVGGTESILVGAHDAVVLKLFPFEVEDGVDDVLQRLRPGDRSFLRDVADEEDRNGEALRGGHQQAGGIAHLSDRSRR